MFKLRMWFDEPRVQLTFEKIMEKLHKIDGQFATGMTSRQSMLFVIVLMFR